MTWASPLPCLLGVARIAPRFCSGGWMGDAAVGAQGCAGRVRDGSGPVGDGEGPCWPLRSGAVFAGNHYVYLCGRLHRPVPRTGSAKSCGPFYPLAWERVHRRAVWRHRSRAPPGAAKPGWIIWAFARCSGRGPKPRRLRAAVRAEAPLAYSYPVC